MKLDVGDYYSAAVGNFEIIGQFKAGGLNGNTRLYNPGTPYLTT